MSTLIFIFFFVALAFANDVISHGHTYTRFAVIRQAPSEFFGHITHFAFIIANIPFMAYLRVKVCLNRYIPP